MLSDTVVYCSCQIIRTILSAARHHLIVYNTVVYCSSKITRTTIVLSQTKKVGLTGLDDGQASSRAYNYVELSLCHKEASALGGEEACILVMACNALLCRMPKHAPWRD